ncbi:MAG: DUF3465 domain-containing protein [Candidatus Melainabacteria bacterium]|nr:DUF3465 domain-containing protein [Candidatus Melainabacteria bacterium]
MRPPYIFVAMLIFATALGASGCSVLDQFKQPNSLASRVGNFSPVRLDSDKAEIRAAKRVTPLIKGSRDLDGRQEQFDPAFGAPETQAQSNTERAEMNAARNAGSQFESLGGRQTGSAGIGTVGGGPQFGSAGIGTVGGGAQFGTADVGTVGGRQEISGESHSKSRSKQTVIGNMPGTTVVQSPDSSRFGTAHGSAKPTNFAPTRSATPITDMPTSVAHGTQQGFGCPPAGTASLGGGTNSFGSARNVYGTNSSSSSSSSRPQTNSYTGQSAQTSPSYPSTTASPPSFSTAPNSRTSPRFNTSSDSPPVIAGSNSNSNYNSNSNSNSNSNFNNPSPFNSNPGSADNGQFDNSLPSIAAGVSSPEVIAKPAKSSPWDFKSFRFPSFKFPFQSPSAPPSSSVPSGGSGNDAAIVDAQNNRQRNVVVTITARVKRLLPDDTQGSPHQRFLLQLSNGSTVLVAHNTSLAPHVPLREGDMVTICGEYIWNEKGGVLHYTHHTTNNKHRGGYIEYNRQTYQ